MEVTMTELETKLRKRFDVAVACNDMTLKQAQTESQALVNLCNNSDKAGFSFLVSLILNAVDEKPSINVTFVLYLSALLSKKSEKMVIILTDFGSILSFLIKHVTSSSTVDIQQLAMRCITNISKFKAGKHKLPQISGFISYLCDIVSQGKMDDCALFSIAVLSRLFELYENRIGFGQTMACFSATSFYDTIGATATATAADSAEGGVFIGHMCRLLLHLTRIEQYRYPIAQSQPLIHALQRAMQMSLVKGVTTISAKFAIVSFMNLAGFPANRILLGNTSGLVENLVKSAILAGKRKTIQYCLAALLNLAWEGSNRAKFIEVDGLLGVLVAVIHGTNAKALMYAVGILCNMSCVEDQQLVLGQHSQPDVIGALVHAVQAGSGFTADDAMGSLSNLSAKTLNRVLIARKFEQLHLVFDYIRSHHGVCRQRAVVLLQNLTVTYSSLDFFLQREVTMGDNVYQIQNILRTCEEEQTIAIILQDCICNFINRRQILQEASCVSSPPSTGSHDNATPPLMQNHLVNKEKHNIQLFEILKKTKHETLKLKPQQQLQQQQHQQQKLPSAQITSFEPLKKEAHSRPLNKQKDVDNIPFRALDFSHLGMTTTSSKTDTVDKNSASLNQSFEMTKKIKKDRVNSTPRQPRQPHQQPNTSPQQQPESMAEDTPSSSPITVPVAGGKLKRVPQSTNHNVKVNEVSPVNDVVVTKSFISTRAPGLCYSSDDSDNQSLPKQTKYPSVHKPQSKTSATSAVVVAPVFHDNVAQPKLEVKKMYRKKDRKKNSHNQLKIIEKGGAERKAGVSSWRPSDTVPSTVQHLDAHTKQHVPAQAQSQAHPPCSSRPTSGPRVGGRTVMPPGKRVVEESKTTKFIHNHTYHDNNNNNSDMSVAEEKRPQPPSLLRPGDGGERKRSHHPARRLTYGEDGASKAQSKDFFGNILDTRTDDESDRGGDSKPSGHSQPHAPCAPKSGHSENNGQFVRSEAPRSSSSRKRRNNNNSDNMESSPLHHFFFVKCYIDSSRASELVDRAEELGISTPYLLKMALSEDNETLEKLGMTSVDAMLTLKGLDSM